MFLFWHQTQIGNENPILSMIYSLIRVQKSDWWSNVLITSLDTFLILNGHFGLPRARLGRATTTTEHAHIGFRWWQTAKNIFICTRKSGRRDKARRAPYWRKHESQHHPFSKKKKMRGMQQQEGSTLYSKSRIHVETTTGQSTCCQRSLTQPTTINQSINHGHSDQPYSVLPVRLSEFARARAIAWFRFSRPTLIDWQFYHFDQWDDRGLESFQTHFQCPWKQGE